MNASRPSDAAPLPTSIPEYLKQLRAALADTDPALVQDALYDAEEYLRSELAENPGKSEAEVIAAVAGSYGAPEEVADIYRDTEAKVQTALRPPRPPVRKSALGRFFGVIAEPRTYGALFYLLLSLATGSFYFTWVVTGVSLSVGLSILIIGVPFAILYFGSIRMLSLVEGRIVEVMLGERMPRRPLYTMRDRSIWARIKDLFTDPRIWATQLYFLLMMPLGTFYGTVIACLLILALGCLLTPFALWLTDFSGYLTSIGGAGLNPLSEPWLAPVLIVVGVLLVFVTLHVARGLGHVHAQIAKHMLVKSL